MKEKLRELETKLQDQEIKSQDQSSQIQSQQTQIQSQQSQLDNQQSEIQKQTSQIQIQESQLQKLQDQLRNKEDQLKTKGKIIQYKVIKYKSDTQKKLSNFAKKLFLNDKMDQNTNFDKFTSAKCLFFGIIVNFITQKLKSKHLAISVFSGQRFF